MNTQQYTFPDTTAQPAHFTEESAHVRNWLVTYTYRDGAHQTHSDALVCAKSAACAAEATREQVLRRRGHTVHTVERVTHSPSVYMFQVPGGKPTYISRSVARALLREYPTTYVRVRGTCTFTIYAPTCNYTLVVNYI